MNITTPVFITPALIALACHEANRAYCLAIGDDSQQPWDEAPEWKLQSALKGVEMHLANPDATPEQSHAAWLEHKLAEGWVFGEVKDDEKKQHPCCVPYADLPPEQKAKDYIFRGVVHALARIDEELRARLQERIDQASASTDASTAQAAPAPIADGHVAVKYIGRRPQFTDRNYGTGLTFTTNQVRVMPAEVARKFLRHPDVFAEAALPVSAPEQVSGGADNADDTAKQLEAAQARQVEKDKEQNRIQDVRDRVAQMNKAMLEDYARTNYRQELDKRKTVADLRAQVLGMIDQFGVV